MPRHCAVMAQHWPSFRISKGPNDCITVRKASFGNFPPPDLQLVQPLRLLRGCIY